MKKTNMIYALLFAGAFASCQKEVVSDLAQDNPTGNINFTLSASSGGPTFRTGHADGEGKLVVTWQQGDKIGLFNVVGTETKNANVAFTIQEASDITEEGKKAIFGGDINQSADWDMDFYAYYPYVAGQSDATKIPVSVAEQVIDGTDSKHLAQYDVLVADPLKGVQAGDENTDINFQHIMAVADFKISLPAGAEAQEIRRIRIQRANGDGIATSGTVDITAEAVADRLKITSTEAQQSSVQLATVENVTLAAGESFQARVALFPADWSSETVHIFVDTDKGTYQFDKTNIKAEAGKRHNSELVLENKVPVAVGDYYYADGTWSTSLNANKKAVGVVVYTGQEGGATNGFVAALDTIQTIAGPTGWNVPELANIINVTTGIPTDMAFSSRRWFSPVDFDGKAYAHAIMAKRNEGDYAKLLYILKSVDYMPEGVTSGPAAQTNWYTATWSQWHEVARNYALINERVQAAGGVNMNLLYWTCNEVDLNSINAETARQNNVWIFSTSSFAINGGITLSSTTKTSTGIIVRPFLNF